MFAPAIGAAACWLTLRRELPSFGQRIQAGPFGWSVLLAVIAVISYVAVLSITNGRAPQIPAEVAGLPVVIMIGAQILGALAEELGFRGILLHTFYQWLPRPVAVLLVGVLFGLWHVQYFGLPLIEHLAFILGTVGLTVTMAYVMVGSLWQRMTICTIIHAGINLALAFSGRVPVPMTALLLAVAVGGLIVVPTASLIRLRSVAGHPVLR